jgi:hypothetical protein
VYGHFYESSVPESRLLHKKVDLFMPPPLGISKPTDFNPTCHLKLIEEPKEEEEEIDLAN